MDWQKDYFSKFKTASEAVSVVKSGDQVAYGEFVTVSMTLDKALAARVNELENIILRSTTCPFPPAIVMADPKMEHVVYNDWHYSPACRKLGELDLCRYTPMNYHQGPISIDRGLIGDIDVLMLMAGPPDDQGYLKLGPSSSIVPAYLRHSRHVIVEINESLPVCFATETARIHVSQVDTFVQGPNRPLIEVPTPPPTDIDVKIAEHALTLIDDGACIQLGIGAMPNAIGQLIGQSGLKNLGVHTEMLCDAYVYMYEGGCINGSKKTTDPGKMVYTFAMGTKKLYDFIDSNPDCLLAPVDYTNDPFITAQNDNLICLNNALEIDLLGQVASETSGIRQISGTGGQLDFLIAADHSKNGKGIICLSSTYTDKNGNLQSRIKPALDPFTVVTVPRSYCQYVITEYGIADLRARTVWERTEALINITHPDFRDELYAAAREAHICGSRKF